MISICNITAKLSLNKTLDLIDLFINRDDVSFSKVRDPSKPQRFTSMIWKLPEFKVTALLYASGRIVLVGGKSQAFVKAAASYLFHVLRGEGNLVLDFCNFVGTANFGFNIDLNKLYSHALKQKVGLVGMYEPELFNGFIWHQGNSKTRVTFFHTGKANITGVGSFGKLKDAYGETLKLLISFLESSRDPNVLSFPEISQ